MSEAIKSQYLVLAELKRVEEKVYRLRNELDRIPQEIGVLEKKLAGYKAEYDTAKATYDSQEKAARRAESDLKDKEDYLKKVESKMNEVKTNEEFQAATKENEIHKGERNALEERALVYMTSLENQKKVLQAAEAQYKEKEGGLRAEIARVQEEAKSIQKHFEEQLEKKKSTLVGLGTELISLYNRVASGMNSVPIVKAENGLCLGCNIRLRPQLYNEILGFKQIHRCSKCGKILIANVDEETAPEENAS